MKKKPQVKKQITPLLQPSLFWVYKTYTPQQLLSVQTFLTTYDKQLKAILVQPTLQQNYKILCQKIGYDVHPSLGQGKTVNTKGNVIEQLGQKYLMVVNHKIDTVTLKLLAYVCPLVKLNTIKLSNNNLSTQQIKMVQGIVTKDQNISVLLFEWNPIADIELSKSVFPSFVKSNLTSLIFRSNKMGNIVLKQLVTRIIQIPDLKLKYLDLYDNQLTQQSIPVFVNLLLVNNTLQHLELSKNKLESENTLKQLLDSIGMFPISSEQLQSHRQLQKQRDDTIERNKKRKKGTPEEPLPNVPKVEQIKENWVYVRNNKLKSMNLSWNSIGTQSFNYLKDFLKRVNPVGSDPCFFLNLTGNQFNNKEQQALKTKQGTKI